MHHGVVTSAEPQALAALREHGFWLTTAEQSELKGLALALGRPSSWEVLLPKTQAAGRVGSFSSTFGLGAFPWHTDGAIAACPPRYLFLRAPQASITKTDLLDIPAAGNLSAVLRRAVLRRRQSHGPPRYFSASEVIDGHRLYRWDPHKLDLCTGADVAMPGDQHVPHASVSWEAGTTVVIDNWRCLHRREAMREQVSERTLERLYIY